MNNKIAVLSLLIILVLVNWSIIGKEKHLAEGKVVYLKLAPVDPRSLMQGDYMALRFGIANQVRSALPKSDRFKRWRQQVDAADGYVVVTLDERNIALFAGLYNNQALGGNQIRLRYRVRNGKVKFASNAFFFQEGHASDYQPARYGQFRVNEDGELLLVAMADQDLNILGAVK